MATSYIEDASGQIIYSGPERRRVPSLDLLSFLFDSPHCNMEYDAPLHVSAADPSISITKRQTVRFTKSTAYTLRNQYDIGKHGPNVDVVSCIFTGHHLAAVVFFATIAAGGVFSAASASSTTSELARQLKLGKSKLLICCKDTMDVAVAAAKDAGLPQAKVLVLGDGASVELRVASTGESIKTNVSSMAWRRITDEKALADSLICLIYSSGTTGLPKGVQLSHANIVAEAFLGCEPLKEYNRVNRPNFHYRTIGHLPIAHIAGIQGYLVNPACHGGPVYWMPKFEFQKFLKYNRRYKITYFFSVPPIYLLIAKSPEVKDHFDNLVVAISGAAPLGKDLQYAASSRLGKGQCFITQTWGLSETTGSFTLLPNGWKDDTGSVSCLMSNSLARIVDDDGKDVPVGGTGEIICKGPMVTKGYYNNPEANKESFMDGWFCTGDVGSFKNGQFYVTDRKKELIKYKGLQIAPAELEAHLLTHPDIQDTAVIGVQRDETEVPRAYVVANQNKISESDIQKFVKENFAYYKQLRGGVVFLDAIPKSASGKILRKDLREMAKKENKAKL